MIKTVTIQTKQNIFFISSLSHDDYVYQIYYQKIVHCTFLGVIFLALPVKRYKQINLNFFLEKKDS
jgi:hypothetical protein